jgi:hypothetical protein
MNLEAIKRLATCDECESYLDSPVILPCSRIICESHLKEPNAREFQNFFYCSVCKSFHPYSSQGFKKMDKIKEIILTKSHLCKEEKKLNNSIDEKILDYENLAKTFDTSKTNSEILVHAELNLIRNKIDTDVEIMKSKLDATRQRLFEIIEKEKQIFNIKLNQTQIDGLEKVAKDLKAKWSKYIRNPDINKNKAFKLEIEAKLKTIKEELKSFEAASYRVLNYNYKSKTNFIDAFDSDDFFGEVNNSSSAIYNFSYGQKRLFFTGNLDRNMVIIKNEFNNSKITLAKLKEIIESNTNLDNSLTTAYELIDLGASSDSIISANLNKCFIKHLQLVGLDNTLLSLLHKIIAREPNQINDLVELNIIPKLISLLSSDNVLTCSKSVSLLNIICNFNREKFAEIAIQSGIYDGLVVLMKKNESVECAQDITSLLVCIKLNNKKFMNRFAFMNRIECKASIIINYFLKLIDSFNKYLTSTIENIFKCFLESADFIFAHKKPFFESG